MNRSHVALLIALAACKAGDKKDSAAAAGSVASPNDLPAGLPLYPGARVVSSSLGTGPSGKPTRNVVLTTSDSQDKVRTFYDPWITGPKHGPAVHVSVTSGGDGTNVTLVPNVM